MAVDNEFEYKSESIGNDFSNVYNPIDQKIKELCQSEGIIPAIKYYKDAKNVDLRTAKDYVVRFTQLNNIQCKKGNCFIATACYGNYDAREVLLLREYRDNVLLNYNLGFYFVRMYYFVSPPIANLISKSKILKQTTRSFLLPIIKHLEKEKRKKPNRQQVV